MSIKRICTHNGAFHADESLAVWMLKVLPAYKNASVSRSRDPEVWDQADIVVDVSGQYDGKRLFDHHQRGFNEVLEPFTTKLSSAGLIYKHFGREVIQQLLSNHGGNQLSTSDMNVLYNRIYEHFIQALDANDNGINVYPEEVKPLIPTSAITLPGIVSSLNPAWNGDQTDAAQNAMFFQASELMGKAFESRTVYYGLAWLPARSLVKEALQAAAESSTPAILQLSKAMPWKEHLFDLEQELVPEVKPIYVVYPDSGGSWRVQAVPTGPDTFESRKALPEPWRGVRDEDLSSLTGVPGCIFVHASGFIGGAKTNKSALQLATMALDM
ncbi:hypothetical protein CANCADRAFT_82842 [Tortispora caseinolytica NRRL Y-17796]|uniref:Metal-dependent protein hydrolase n=1 Tax=Tortispora caseinolytica NRRL Y-17796 TaxID=767744 RepID=A0A1E4TK74_9ASCO|nr:hypothetical protein CANCADRAFT_82842 [Tortispora caseinolytica NRRL Y-17796]